MGQTTFTGPVISNNGFIDASFTTAERDAIVDPQPGLLIYNTDTNTYQVCTVGGGVPTWDTAFGGGGGGGGFPYLLANITNSPALSNAFGLAATKLLFNAAGTQVLGMNPGVGFNVSALGTPYDLNSVASTISQGTALGGQPMGAYINGDGTKLTFLVSSGYQVQSQTIDLNTPYDLTSFNSATLSGVNYLDVANMSESLTIVSFEMSSDGTKILFTLINSMSSSGATGYIRTVELAVPYDMTSAVGGTYSASVDISGYFSPVQTMMNASKAWGIALNSTGTVIYVSTSGNSSGSMAPTKAYIFEFKLGTAYDISTIQTSYYQATPWIFDATTNSGTFNIPNSGITLANGNIYVGFYDYSTYSSPAYNASSLTALSAPNITGVSPSSGVATTSVTITGTGFTGTTSVTFGGVNAGFTVVSNTQLFATAPSGLPSGTPVDVVVTNPAGSSTEVAAFTNTGPAATTYYQNLQYNMGGVQFGFSFLDNVWTLKVSNYLWNSGDWMTVTAKPAGTSVININIPALGTYSGTVGSGGFVQVSPGIYQATIDGVNTPPFGLQDVSEFTI